MGEIDKAVMTNSSIYLAVAFIVLLAAIGIWDVVAIVNTGDGQTVSAVVIEWSQKFPFFPFIVGLIIGHLFFPVK